MQRITKRNLEALCDRLNTLTNSPPQQFRAGTLDAQVGHHYISGAYGGHQLVRVTNPQGGVTTLLGTGHIPARQLYDLMQAYMAGIKAAREQGEAKL